MTSSRVSWDSARAMLTICWPRGERCRPRGSARSPGGRAGRAGARAALGVGRAGEKPAATELVAEEDVLGDARSGDQVELLVDRRDAVRRSRRAAWPARPARPSQTISPSSGWWAPASTLISVDLPAPFWPSRQCTSPARTSRSTPSERADARELLDDAASSASSRRRSSDGSSGGRYALGNQRRVVEDGVEGDGRRRRGPLR